MIGERLPWVVPDPVGDAVNDPVGLVLAVGGLPSLLLGPFGGSVADRVNLPASRLSALLLVVAAALRNDALAKEAWRAVWRDAPHHRSPNAGYPEAAMAGALGLSLAGPRTYGGIFVDDAMMGNGRRDAKASDIRRALALYHYADGILIVTLMAITAALIGSV